VLPEDRGDRAARHTPPSLVSRGDVAHDQDAEQRRHRGDQAHHVGAAHTPVGHRQRADERADEDADPVDAAERRQRPGAQVDGDRLGEVRLAGQPEDARGHAEQAERDAQHDKVRSGGTAGHADRFDRAGGDEGPALADPRGQRAGRQVRGELGDPDQR